MSDNLLQSLSTLSEPLKISFGPCGNDHLIISGKHSTITNDGATVLSLLIQRSKKNTPTNTNTVLSNMITHPVLNLLIKCSKTQEKIAGDGTTSVVLLVGALAEQIRKLLKNYPKNLIIESLQKIRNEVDLYKFQSVFNSNEVPEELYETHEFKMVLKKIVKTSLSSKILDPFSERISDIAIQAVLKSNREFERIKIHKMYGSIDEMTLIEGHLVSDDEKIINVLMDKISINKQGGKLKSCFIQFCLSPPKPNLDTSVTINESHLIDKLIKDERVFLKNLIRKIKEAGIEILFIQNSLTRESVSELAEYYLKKANIPHVILNREVMEKLCYDLKIKKSQSINYLDVFEFNYTIETVGSNSFLILQNNDLLTLNITGTDIHIRDEVERSLHDAMSVIRCLIEDPFYCYGGGYFELSFSNHLREKYCSVKNENIQNINLCMQDLIKGIEQLPYYLAINAGYDFNLIEDLKLAINNKRKLGIIPNLLTNYNDFLYSFAEKRRSVFSDEDLTESLNLRKELIGEKLKCFDVSDILIPKKVVKSQIVLACELLEVVSRIDEVLPARN